MSELRKPKTDREHRDVTRIQYGLPPLTRWGNRYLQAMTPTTHTGVYAQKPNKSIHINS